ncbi:MAG: sigma factor-like helix-turn-helix DNA-binding protein [Bryobacteraceae bacterium]
MPRTPDFETSSLGHLDEIYRVAYSLLPNQASAQSAVERTYLEADRKGAPPAGISTRVWLLSILIRTIRRSPARWFSLPLRKGEVDPVFRALQKVPFREAAAVVLSDAMDLSGEDMAAILQTSAGTIAACLARARRILAANLTHYAKRESCVAAV